MSCQNKINSSIQHDDCYDKYVVPISVNKGLLFKTYDESLFIKTIKQTDSVLDNQYESCKMHNQTEVMKIKLDIYLEFNLYSEALKTIYKYRDMDYFGIGEFKGVSKYEFLVKIFQENYNKNYKNRDKYINQYIDFMNICFEGTTLEQRNELLQKLDIECKAKTPLVHKNYNTLQYYYTVKSLVYSTETLLGEIKEFTDNDIKNKLSVYINNIDTSKFWMYQRIN